MKHPIEEIEWGVIPVTVYRGCLLTRLVGGYEIFNQRVQTPQQVDEVIDKASDHLKNSLTVKNNGSMESQQG